MEEPSGGRATLSVLLASACLRPEDRYPWNRPSLRWRGSLRPVLPPTATTLSVESARRTVVDAAGRVAAAPAGAGSG